MGIILYEMIYGDIPGKGDDDEARIKDIQNNGIKFPYNIRITQ